MARARRPIALIAGAALLSQTACTIDPYTGEKKASNTAKGAGIGAVVGGVAGAVIGGGDSKDRRKRAMIGAGVGALGGGAVGYYMDRQEAKLRQELQGTGVSVTRQGDNLILNMPGNVTFKTDSADISADFYPVLRSVSLVLKEFDKTIVDVGGHTDSTGSLQYNQDLSVRRATSVKSYLVSQGVADMRFAVNGYGPNMPVADNSTPQGRQANRRVEIVLAPVTQ
jgi:outer membrane protein OmpA-like peptidoglycan-associated protein